MFFILFLVSLGSLSIGWYFLNSYEFGLCFFDAATRMYDVSCHQTFERIGSPLYHATPALTLVFLALAIYPAAFSVWKKFAVWATPLLVFILSAYTPGYWDPAHETVFKFSSWLYAILSLAIIGVTIFRARKKS